jgi:hypothetical protein
VLSTAIGPKEHGGHVKGMSSKLTIKDGFQQDRTSYKRHDRYKEEMKEVAEKELEAKFKEFFLAQMAEQQQSRLLWITPAVRGGATTDGDDGPLRYWPKRIRHVLRAVSPLPQHNHTR